MVYVNKSKNKKRRSPSDRVRLLVLIIQHLYSSKYLLRAEFALSAATKNRATRKNEMTPAPIYAIFNGKPKPMLAFKMYVFVVNSMNVPGMSANQ